MYCSPRPTLPRPNSQPAGSWAGSSVPGVGELPWRTGIGRFRQRLMMRWAAAVARGRWWGRKGTPEQGDPWWHNPSGRERRWWHRGAVEGTSKVVKGRRRRGPKRLSAVAQRRRARRWSGAMQRWWSGWRRKKGGCSTVVCSSYSCNRRWTMAAWQRERWAGKRRRRQSCGCEQSSGNHCPKVGAHGWAPLSGQWGWQVGPRSFIFFQFIQNQFKLVKSKWMPYLGPKIPNCCMRLD
jgi:hypothetical protein